jgi:hypothetical protein
LNHARSEPLLEALAELYTYSKRFTEALDALIALKRDSVFELIEKYNLHDAISDKVLHLLQLSTEK